MRTREPRNGLERLSRNGNGHDSALHRVPSDVKIDVLVSQEKQRLTAELGITDRVVVHAARPAERPFTRAERPFTTVLFGGLTWKHERLIQAMMTGHGYIAEYLPTPTVRAFQAGKEYGNNGQCNPTYFTVGNLVEYLVGLEAEGLSRREIIDKYVFFTAGACGPCRFGMYEAEFRLALRNAGFDGFRVLILEQTGGLNQALDDAGLELNLDFTLGLLNAFMIADILNDVAYQLRPFEREPGATDTALKASIERMAAILAERPTYMVDKLGFLQRTPAAASASKLLSRFLDQIVGNRIVLGMRECREIFAGVDVDRTRVRPIVKITGEFWAQTTEGDGNFNMFRFLEKEGAQVLVEPIATWLLYMLHQARQENLDRRYLDVPKNLSGLERFRARARSRSRTVRKSVALRIAEVVFVREYNRLRAAFGNMPHALTDQYEMQRIAHPYYNTRLEGGEGHLEVAKNIYYTNKNLCHMVLSVKPFGCMPSTQSDGVQSAVISHFKDILYLPIETSGEGEINAHSRVQMVLGEARTKARLEMEQTLASAGLTMEEFKSMASEEKRLSDAFFALQDQSALIGVSARFCSDIAHLSRRKKVSSAV